MSHLGELITAFVDGEVTGAQRDRVTAHLVRCDRCQIDVAELRQLKSMLGGLSGSPGDAGADLAARLLAVPQLADEPQNEVAPCAPHPPLARGGSSRKPARLDRPGGRARRRPGGPTGPRDSRTRTGKRRYVVLGAVSVMVGLGAAAYSFGGSDAGPGPSVTPPVELYSEEHAITTGEVPFSGQAGVMGVAHVGPSAKAGKGSRGR